MNRSNILGGAVAVALASLASMPAAHAFKFDTGNEDLKVRWDNTVKYSLGYRLKDPSATLIADRNADDGDRNFRKGDLISNRLDLLSEFDLTYNSVGFRMSGAAWYDRVYNRKTGHDSPATWNPLSVPVGEFTRATRDLHGRKAELLDAFVFGRVDLGEMTLSGRLGKHTVLYGESLFFGANGVAGAQTAIDIIKALSVPSTPFKELLMPINQVSGQLQVRPNLSIGAYYQFDWKRNRIPASGQLLLVGGLRRRRRRAQLRGPHGRPQRAAQGRPGRARFRPGRDADPLPARGDRRGARRVRGTLPLQEPVPLRERRLPPGRIPAAAAPGHEPQRIPPRIPGGHRGVRRELRNDAGRHQPRRRGLVPPQLAFRAAGQLREPARETRQQATTRPTRWASRCTRRCRGSRCSRRPRCGTAATSWARSHGIAARRSRRTPPRWTPTARATPR